MRRSYLVLLCITLAAGTAHASDPCQTLLCMAGKLQGKSGAGDCDTPMGDYFSIVKFGKHGRFNASGTASARLSFLNSCSAPGVGDWPNQINAAYGTIQSL